jgi:hypothetical protein
MVGSWGGAGANAEEGIERGMACPAPIVFGAVAPKTSLVTDDWPSYNRIPDIKHKAITVGPMAAHIALPWTHPDPARLTVTIPGVRV